MKTKLKDIVNLFRPQVGVEIEVKSNKTSAVIYRGPAHHLTGAESFCQKIIKDIAIVDGNYVVKIAE